MIHFSNMKVGTLRRSSLGSLVVPIQSLLVDPSTLKVRVTGHYSTSEGKGEGVYHSFFWYTRRTGSWKWSFIVYLGFVCISPLLLLFSFFVNLALSSYHVFFVILFFDRKTFTVTLIVWRSF